MIPSTNQILDKTGWSVDELSRILKVNHSRDLKTLRKAAAGKRVDLKGPLGAKLTLVGEVINTLDKACSGDTGAIRSALYQRDTGVSIYDHLAAGDYRAAAAQAKTSQNPVEDAAEGVDENAEPVRIETRKGRPPKPLFRGKRTMFIRKTGDAYETVLRVGSEIIEHYVTPEETGEVQVGDIYVGRVVRVFDEYMFCDLGDITDVFCTGNDVGVPAGEKLGDHYKPGDTLLIEVRSLGNLEQKKGPSGTARFTLAGRTVNIQATPGGSDVGIIVARSVGAGYKNALKFAGEYSSMPPQLRVVIHGAGGRPVWQKEMLALLRRFSELETEVADPTPRRVHDAGNALSRVLRDRGGPDTTIWVEGGHDVVSYVVEASRGVGQVRRWDSDTGDMFTTEQLTEALASSHQRVVELATGGNLVFDSTEAGTVIDVNAGSSDREATNLAAAREIARQIRLRDLGGLIMVDFAGGGFDLDNEHEITQVIDALYRAVQGDPGRVRIAFSPELYFAIITRRYSGYTAVGFEPTGASDLREAA